MSDKDRTPKSNEGLRAFYEAAYSRDPATTFSNWTSTEADAVVARSLDWSGKRVLDIGCGTGRLARMLRAAGAAEVVGLDYAAEAIAHAEAETADAAISYVCADVFDYTPDRRFDALTTLGTMEHMDDPAAFLRRTAGFIGEDGRIVVTCPHFLNLRGIVWMTLAQLLLVPMSLSDLHFIHPWDMQGWCDGAGLAVEDMITLDDSRANGERLLSDFEKRLPNALRDAGLDVSRVPEFLDHLRSTISYISDHKEEISLHGATARYVLRRAA